MFAQVLAASLLLFVKDAFTQDECTNTTGFYRLGTCYNSGTYVHDLQAKEWLECRARDALWTSCDDPVRCSSNPDVYPRLRVPTASDFTDEHAGDYECCSPDAAICSTRIVAKIFNDFIFYNAWSRVDARDDYRIYCQTIGRGITTSNFQVVYQDGSEAGVVVSRPNCRRSGYRCGLAFEDGYVDDSISKYRQRSARVRWSGDESSGNLFRQDVNNGDHCYKCRATRGDLTRTMDVGCITAPASAPTLTVDGCSVSWTYPDMDDVDGYLYVGGSDNEETTDTSRNFTLGGTASPGDTMSVSVRAYQQILGPAAQADVAVCPDTCSACRECSMCGVCTCNDGWEGDDCCQDIDECEAGTSGCNQICTNNDGGFECSCNDGYVLNDDGKICSDINECDTDNGGCSHNCTNNDGGFECTCPDGYSLGDDGKTCSDINECDTDDGGCSHTCTNTDGSFECSCNEGYRLGADGLSCSDINECAEDIDGCDEICRNNEGSFTCSCPSEMKYFLADDGKSCTSIIYDDGYPTTQGRNLKAIVRQPPGIAENSTIECAIVACSTCNTPIATVDCSYGEEFSFEVITNRRRCISITVSFTGGRSKRDVLCLWPAAGSSCSASLQGQRVVYGSNSVTLHFGPISIANELVCDLNDSGFESCSDQFVANNPEGTNTLVVCPVNADNLCNSCRCGEFQFNHDDYGLEFIRFPTSNVCPTEI